MTNKCNHEEMLRLARRPDGSGHWVKCESCGSSAWTIPIPLTPEAALKLHEEDPRRPIGVWW